MWLGYLRPPRLHRTHGDLRLQELSAGRGIMALECFDTLDGSCEHQPVADATGGAVWGPCGDGLGPVSGLSVEQRFALARAAVQEYLDLEFVASERGYSVAECELADQRIWQQIREALGVHLVCIECGGALGDCACSTEQATASSTAPEMP